jgi:alpha-L-fucosidase
MSPKEYDDYFINQIRELLTSYGKIDYLWFDGCGSEGHEYDTVRIVKEIRACQPHILLFNMWDPDTRWVGNEAGVAHSPNHLIVDKLDFSVLTEKKDSLERAKFLPAECDCRMRSENWFYSSNDSHTVKSVDELMGLYYYSVGRGANLLINIGPDRRGKLPAEDKNALLSFGEKIKMIKENTLPCEKEYFDKKIILSTEQRLINQVILSEKITNEEVEEFEIKVYPYPYGAPVTVYRGTTIGHKAICAFPTIRITKVEIVFDKSKQVSATLQYIPLY